MNPKEGKDGDRERDELMKVRKASLRFNKVFKLNDGTKVCENCL